jgi:NAD(P)H dehydrogenase (quinone)
MHALIVLAHPEAKSFNAQMAETAREAMAAMGHMAEISDLYRQGFDAREDLSHFSAPKAPDWLSAQTEQRHAHDTGTLPAGVAAEMEKLERADLVILRYPIWWVTMPAILKGWFDRVFVHGAMYTSKMRFDRGRFMGRRAFASISTGAPASTHGPDGRNGDTDLLMWPMQHSPHYPGYTVPPSFYSFSIESGIQYSDPSVMAARVQGYKDGLADRLSRLDELKPLRCNGWDDWDEDGKLKPDAPVYSPFMRHPE